MIDATWARDELDRISAARELQIATKRADGTCRRWVPIWVVRAADQVYVRTWHRRDTGWFGHVLDVRCARVRAPGLELDIAVRDIGDDKGAVRAAVDAAYRAKYGRYGEATVSRMVTDDAAATTLLLTPVRDVHTGDVE